MLAAYTFGSAEELTEFCERHRIGREDTYSVLQSLVAPIWEGECYAEMRLTLVLTMAPEDLERIKERERTHHQGAHDEHVRLVEQQRIREQHAQREATRRRGGPADDIPF